MRLPLFTPEEDFWYTSLLEAEAGLGQLKKSTTSRLEPATFWLVA
jgi:hypothetical protein